ncbi:MAG TPA: hypothetical protein VK427_13320, partial [Kofleriaceae bacterium]|nr:hypothetical protein [Kofleriaceae bacterium]
MPLLDEVKTGWEYVSTIEPALGKVTRDELRRVEGSIAAIEHHAGELAELAGDELDGARSTIAMLYARGAAIAVAAGEEGIAQRWFDAGQPYATDEAYAAQLAEGRREPERFRQLAHGRYLIAKRREAAARKLWRDLVKANATGAIALAAKAEQQAPRPLDGASPTLWTLNGVGLGFAGSRDAWDDGS